MGFSRQEYWSGVPLPSPVFGAREGQSLTINNFKKEFGSIIVTISMEA